MKNAMILTLTMLVIASAASANTICAVQRESTPDQYDKQVVMKSLENKNAEVELYKEGDLSVYVNTASGNEQKNMTIFIGNPKAKTYTTIGFGEGKMLSVIDGAHRLSVACSRDAQ